VSQHLYLVDGSGYIFRAYHKLPPLTNPEGTPVGAVYGFTTMLWKLVKDLSGEGGPSHLAVVFDKGSQSFRNEMYADYKAHRPPPPEDLVPQFPLVRDAVRAFSLPCIEVEGFEADDVIATYALKARDAGMAVTIVSSDKDLMQLVGQGIDLWDTLGNRRIGPDEVREKFGVGPDKLGEVLALMGDSVDNVPGVPGIGPKFASDLINTFGDVETLLGRVDEVKRPKQREALIEHADKARLSRELVKLHCEAPLPVPIEDMGLKPTPPDPLRDFLGRMGFKSLVAKVDAPGAFIGTGAAAAANTAAPVAPQKPFDLDAYELILSADRLRWWASQAVDRGLVAVDTETDELGAMTAGLCGISLALEPGLACYVPLDHRGDGLLSERPAQLTLEEVRAVLSPVFADPGVLKIGQNLKYDALVLERHGFPEPAPYDDTMLMSYALEAGTRGGHGMDELSEKHLGHVPVAFKDVCGAGRKAISFAQVDLRQATRYAAEDADVTLRLHQLFKPRLSAERVTRVYERIDRPLVSVVADMERAGIHVDRAALAGLSQVYGEAIVALEREIHEAAGGPFNLGSVKQLGEVLFERLGLPAAKKGKSGAYGTDESILQKLAEDGAAVPAKVLEWRQLTKLKSTYTDALQAAINPATGRVHTCFSLAATSTGRLSSTDPNLQNIPIRTELGRRIREAFVAEPGNVLIAADYNQIELRLMAHMAEEPALIEVYQAGQDVHTRTACEVFGCTPETMTREHRARAKTINFSIIYGISAFGLGSRLGIARDEAGDYIARYFSRYPAIRAFMADQQQLARAQGFVTTIFGRKCHVPQITSKNQAERGFAERVAVNAPVQGSAADLIKRAMIRMPAALRAAGCGGTRMLLQVHDELVFEAPEAEAEQAGDVIRAVMAGAAEPWLSLKVPLGVEVGFGRSWGAAH
jgi:DNA polymerase-1